MIKTFYFENAKYRVGDGGGSEVILAVDYRNGKYKVLGRSPVLKQQASFVAESLIKRKRNVNFSDNIKV